jgi:Family of unknown function (DUF5995)
MRAHGRAVTLLLAGLLAAGVLAAGGTAAAQPSNDPPPFVDWTSILPTLTAGFDPTSSNICVSGRIRCIDSVIAEMKRRFNPQARSCNHDAIFSLTYLRTTEEYRRAATTPGFFEDPAFVNHEAAVFARYYFDAFDDWHAGRTAEVPVAWQIAFEAADDQHVSGGGNLFLGMAAHINRDLPFTLHEIGLIKPDGSSRKPDHDQVNEFLNRVTEPLLAEIARRFDPSVSSNDVPGTQVDATALFQLVAAWREQAWRNAERLAGARNSLDLAVIRQEIETASANTQRAIRTQNAYHPPVSSPAPRNAFCATHWNSP